MKSFDPKKYVGVLLLLCFACCSRDGDVLPMREQEAASDVISSLEISKNPSRIAPLTAKLLLTTTREVKVRIKVAGRHGAPSDAIKEFPELQTNFELPILGLYPDHNNQVEIALLDQDGQVIASEEVEILTDPLIPDLPEIRIDIPPTGTIGTGFNFVNYFGYTSSFLPQRPFLFDQFGDIRWYLNFSGHARVPRLFYDNGMSRLRNNNLISGDKSTGGLYEFNMLGELVNSWPIQVQGFRFHHHVIEKPDGNLLVTVNDDLKPTEEDVILELDRDNGAIVNKWDLTLSLDQSRRAWPNVLGDGEVDWFHANGLAYSEADNSIIVSGVLQGVVKLTENNEVGWILAPHLDWGTSGNEEDLSQYLLQPLDAEGRTITDREILDGRANHPEFEWPWYQHSPVLMPNGHLLIFDNGDNRNFGGETEDSYSRAVVYEIDEINKTVQQVWSYGKERGAETYSRIVSKVAYLSEPGNVLFAPGAISSPTNSYGKIIEINQESGQVRFEATIIPPGSTFNMTFHSVHRMPLYGN